MRNLVNFHSTTQKSESFFSMGSFYPKRKRFELKKYRGVILHDTEDWWKLWTNPDLTVSKTAWGIGRTFIRAIKSLKYWTVMGSFFPQHIMFPLENLIGFICHDTERWCKIQKKTESQLEIWRKEFRSFSYKQSKLWKFPLWWAPFVQSV